MCFREELQANVDTCTYEAASPSPAPPKGDDSDSNDPKPKLWGDESSDDSVGLDDQRTPPWNTEDAVATAPVYTPHQEKKNRHAIPNDAPIV